MITPLFPCFCHEDTKLKDTLQVISHLKLTALNLGYLINFNVPLIKQGIKRFRV